MVPVGVCWWDWVCYDGQCNAAAAWSKRSWLWFKWMLLHFSFLTFTTGNRKCSLSTSAALCFTAVHEVTVDTFHRENNPPRIFFLFSPPQCFSLLENLPPSLVTGNFVFCSSAAVGLQRECVCQCVYVCVSFVSSKYKKDSVKRLQLHTCSGGGQRGRDLWVQSGQRKWESGASKTWPRSSRPVVSCVF